MNRGCKDCLSRRRFLEITAKTLSAAALATPALLTACSQDPLGPPTGNAGAGGSTTIPNQADNNYVFNFSDYPLLASTGGSINVTIDATSGPKTVFITRVSNSSVDVVSTICTHAGCTLNSYNSSTQQYFCPCHGSLFNANGSVAQGPATVDLPSYPATLTSTGIEVTVS